MLVLGITGGIGSGKGVATAFFRSRGAAIVDADEVAGELTKPGAALTARIISEFGCEFALDSGGLDRRRLAARVTEGRTSIACVVAPLLLEAGWARGRGVDRVLLMVADDEERVRRVVARDGLSAAEVRLRMAQQMPAEKQRRQADWVVDTTADRAEVLRQLASVWEELNRLSARLIG
jgi:dephospho-CoA kinase